MSSFAFKTEKFEGPLELLLDLIERRKMHISDVSLSDVADKFLAHIETLGELPVSDTANFVYVASILLLIKSRALLPDIELDREEEASIEDLERRLAIYKLLKEQTVEISRVLGKSVIYSREETRDLQVVFAPPGRLDTNELWQIARQLLEAAPKEEILEQKTVKSIISLEEMIERLAERMQNTLKSSFRTFAKLERSEKVNVIVSFLAMLELVKRGALEVRQHAHFDDIEMEITSTSTPTYA